MLSMELQEMHGSRQRSLSGSAVKYFSLHETQFIFTRSRLKHSPTSVTFAIWNQWLTVRDHQRDGKPHWPLNHPWLVSTMSKKDAIISIPDSPTGATTTATTPTISDIETPPRSPASSAASNSPASDAPLQRDPPKRQSGHKDTRDLSNRLKRCRDKTLESELCRTINKYARRLMSDDQCRRATAIAIIIFAVIGLYHVLGMIFWLAPDELLHWIADWKLEVAERINSACIRRPVRFTLLANLAQLFHNDPTTIGT